MAGKASSAPPIDIGIPANQRQQIAEGLSRVLADSTVLDAKTHGFHWNVTGPMFNTLHLMFMEQYTELWNALDEIAERIRALGHVAPFGGSPYRGLSSIPETDGVPPPLAMGRELVEGHEAVARAIRSVFATADEASDQPTANQLTQRLQIHEKPPGCCAACWRAELLPAAVGAGGGARGLRQGRG